jgi:hypothetical protein
MIRKAAQYQFVCDSCPIGRETGESEKFDIDLSLPENVTLDNIKDHLSENGWLFNGQNAFCPYCKSAYDQIKESSMDKK